MIEHEEWCACYGESEETCGNPCFYCLTTMSEHKEWRTCYGEAEETRSNRPPKMGEVGIDIFKRLGFEEVPASAPPMKERASLWEKMKRFLFGR